MTTRAFARSYIFLWYVILMALSSTVHRVTPMTGVETIIRSSISHHAIMVCLLGADICRESADANQSFLSPLY